MKNKKGSHVEIVVAFVLFIGFLFFLYLLLQPVTSRERDKQYILDYLKLTLIENSTVNYTTVTITVNTPTAKDCINTNRIDNSQIPAEYRDKLIIKNSSDDVLKYQISGQGFKIKTGIGFVGVLKAYYSDEISGSQTSLTGCSSQTVNIGVIKTYQDIFETKLEDLNKSYYADYEGLKARLGIPEGTEFSFYLYDSERNEPPLISAEKSTPPETTSVYIDEVPIQYINNEGELSFGFLVIKVW